MATRTIVVIMLVAMCFNAQAAVKFGENTGTLPLRPEFRRTAFGIVGAPSTDTQTDDGNALRLIADEFIITGSATILIPDNAAYRPQLGEKLFSGWNNNVGGNFLWYFTAGGDFFLLDSFTVDDIIVDSMTVGGGYGSTGTTLSSAGVVQMNGALTVDDTSTLTGTVQVGGGFGDTGIDLESDGDIKMDGVLSFDAATQSITGTTPYLMLNGFTGGKLLSGGNEEWLWNAARFRPTTDGGGTIGSDSFRPAAVYAWLLDATGIANIVGLISTGVGLDAIGAVDLDYGSADVTDHTFLTDSTGDSEIVLPLESIGAGEVLNDTLDFAQFSDSMTLDNDTQISFGSSNFVFQIANPSSEAFDINGTGNFQSDLAHFHQHDGNPSGPGNILHLEAEDEDITPIFHISQSDATLNGNVVGMLINISDDDDPQFTPFEYRDDKEGNNDLLFSIDYLGGVVMEGDLAVSTDTLFVDISEDAVGIGTTTPGSELDILGEAENAAIVVKAQSNTTTETAILALQRGRGTVAAPTPTAAGDTLGSIRFQGEDILGNNDQAVSLTAIADTGHADGGDNSDSPGYLMIGTTPDGSAAPIERVRVTSDGLLAMKDITGPPATLAGFSGIYSDSGELQAFDASGNSTPISPHSSRIINASGDPLDPSPWFMISTNNFTGIRVIMYMSNYMRHASGLPVSSTEFIWYETIPNRDKQNPITWRKRAKREAIRAYKSAILDASPTIEIQLAQATRYNEDTEIEEYSEYVTRYIVEPDTGEVVERTRLVKRRRRVPLGTYSHKLRPGVTLDPGTGKFYRTRRVSDVPTPATGELEFPDLPQWVKDRLPD